MNLHSYSIALDSPSQARPSIAPLPLFCPLTSIRWLSLGTGGIEPDQHRSISMYLGEKQVRGETRDREKEMISERVLARTID